MQSTKLMIFLSFIRFYGQNLKASVPNVTKGPSERYLGFTLIEWLVALALVGTIAGIGVPAYYEYVDKADIADAVVDIRSIEQFITRYEVRNGELPDSLADTGAGFTDPWGNPYQYLRIEGAGLKGKGAVRKDKKLNPINSDYDLYSMGKDGDSKKPLTAKASHDDIVRAANGAFVGLAINY